MSFSKILVFGGTAEGRIIYETARERGIDAVLSVATNYGKEVVDCSDGAIIVNRLTESGMEELISHGFELVIDATHPHAREVSPAIKKACLKMGAPLVRILREFRADEAESKDIIRFKSLSEAIEFLNDREGNVLAATGAKEIDRYRNLKDFRHRVYARVLPIEASIKACREAGLESSRIIAMQGPFSAELNAALIREFHCRWLVTKDTGVSGGFYEKLQAAKLCGIGVLVINAPKEEGISLQAALNMLEPF